MYLLDTNVVSELRKSGTNKIDQNVKAWAESVEAGHLFVSVLTMAEIEMGVLAMEKRDLTQGALLREWFDGYVKVHFRGRILDVTAEAAVHYARMNVPNRVAVVDGLIAATALANSMRVVTRNTSDFPWVSTINPWIETTKKL
jgi:predicted nucleic acid-binding protein